MHLLIKIIHQNNYDNNSKQFSLNYYIVQNFTCHLMINITIPILKNNKFSTFIPYIVVRLCYYIFINIKTTLLIVENRTYCNNLRYRLKK